MRLLFAVFPFDRGDHAVDARLDLGHGVARDVEVRRHLADGRYTRFREIVSRCSKIS